MMNKYQELIDKHQALLEQRDKQPDTIQVEQIRHFIEQVREAGAQVGDLQQRERLRASLTVWAKFLYEREGEFPETQLAPYPYGAPGENKEMPISKSGAMPSSILWGALALVAVIFVAAAAVLTSRQNTARVSSTATTLAMTVQSQTPVPTSGCPDSSRYGFEDDNIFWVAQTLGDSQSVSGVSKSEKNRAKSGCYSLKLTVDLVAGDPNKSKGEAYVDMRSFPPAGVTAPINLEGTQITMWVYVPRAAAGDPSRPNGVQVFVKDQNWKNEYGTWLNLSGDTDKWTPVTLMPSKQPPHEGYMDNGFDPTSIIVVGIKIGAGEGSSATYSGPIYVDGVNW